MTRLAAQFQIVDEWPVPASWRVPATRPAAKQGSASRRPSLLARMVSAMLAAEARYREMRHVDRMCDRMRRDVGLPEKGADARRQARLIEGWQRWW